jgi:hypothetical protein
VVGRSIGDGSSTRPIFHVDVARVDGRSRINRSQKNTKRPKSDSNRRSESFLLGNTTHHFLNGVLSFSFPGQLFGWTWLWWLQQGLSQHNSLDIMDELVTNPCKQHATTLGQVFFLGKRTSFFYGSQNSSKKE